MSNVLKVHDLEQEDFSIAAPTMQMALVSGGRCWRRRNYDYDSAPLNRSALTVILPTENLRLGSDLAT
jgi:hypothetical protein